MLIIIMFLFFSVIFFLFFRVRISVCHFQHSERRLFHLAPLYLLSIVSCLVNISILYLLILFLFYMIFHDARFISTFWILLNSVHFAFPCSLHVSSILSLFQLLFVIFFVIILPNFFNCSSNILTSSDWSRNIRFCFCV